MRYERSELDFMQKNVIRYYNFTALLPKSYGHKRLKNNSVVNSILCRERNCSNYYRCSNSYSLKI